MPRAWEQLEKGFLSLQPHGSAVGLEATANVFFLPWLQGASLCMCPEPVTSKKSGALLELLDHPTVFVPLLALPVTLQVAG
jgi:hypothetical protein